MKLNLSPRTSCIWTLHIDTEATRMKYMVENTSTWFVDFPIVYDDKRIAYDHPEAIPKYFRSFVEKALLKI